MGKAIVVVVAVAACATPYCYEKTPRAGGRTQKDCSDSLADCLDDRENLGALWGSTSDCVQQ